MMKSNNTYAIANTYAQLERQWKEVERKEAYEVELAKGFSIADMYLMQGYLDRLSYAPTSPPSKDVTDVSKLRVFEITKVVYNPEELINDRLISVYGALHNLKASVATIIYGTPNNTRFFIAVRTEESVHVAGNVLSASLAGNFPGIDIHSLEKNQKVELMEMLLSENKRPKSLATVSFVPSERDDNKREFVQGLEKFIDSMTGKTYCAVFLADSISADELSQRRYGYEELYSTMSPHSKLSVSYATGKTRGVTQGISASLSSSISNSISNTNGTSISTSSGTNYSSNSSFGFSGDGWSGSSGCSSGSFNSYTSGSSFSHSVSSSTSKSETDGAHIDKSDTESSTDTTTLNYENKGVTILLEKANAQLKRIQDCESFGLWKFGCYFFSDDIATTVSAANIYKALLTGLESNVENMHVNIWKHTQSTDIANIIGHAKYLVHPKFQIPAFENYSEQTVTPTSMISGKEMPMVFGFPRKSINGLPVVEMAEFGRAVVYRDKRPLRRAMDFGDIYHMGSTIDLRVPLNVDLFSSHCFITGSSGSGKSYTTYQLLDSLLRHNIKMLVIEPAKGEYKQVFSKLRGLRIFTTDPNVYRLLKINPFQFPENLSVLSHIEKLIQIFNASWELYSAMPAFLKDAVVQAYVSCGWDIQNSIWIEGISDYKYPVFKDVMNILPKLIDASNYSTELKSNYKGALLMRLQSMTTGMAGAIFANHEGISDEILFDSNVIVDLSDIGSEETIALIMGVLIMKLGEYRVSVRKTDIHGGGRDLPLQHMTVLEEAHNILKRTSKDQSQKGANIVGKSVELISNSIKEMRTYGEGFIIIDQSPMAVDESAIENTSTKIIMNTPAKDACEELRSALSLNDEQAKELSRLDVGVAAVFQKGWLEPVLMKVDMWNNAYEGKIQRTDVDMVKVLRGKILEELFVQYEIRFQPMRFKQIIRAVNITDDKKREYEEIIAQLNTQFTKGLCKISKIQLSQTVMKVLSCQSLFYVFHAKDIGSFDLFLKLNRGDNGKVSKEKKIKYKKKCKAWVDHLQIALEQYVVFDNNVLFRKTIQALLWFLSDKASNKSAYTAIYILMEDNKI